MRRGYFPKMVSITPACNQFPQTTKWILLFDSIREIEVGGTILK